MIVLSGTLIINTKGVMTLQCDLGRFAIIDSRLQDIAVGKHLGFFEVQKIEPHMTNGSQGQIQLAMRAVVKQFSLQTAKPVAIPRGQQLSLLMEETVPDAGTAEEITMEIQPATEDAPESAVLDDVFFVETPVVTKGATANNIQAEAFLSEVVELDPTLPRGQLRQEIERLQASGYQLDKASQVWHKAA